MRKFRNAALAVATATTVAISGVSVASAQDNQNPPATENTGSSQEGGLSGSSDLKDKLGWWQDFTGNDVRDWLDPKFEGEANLPLWAKIFVGGGIAAAAASVLGLVVAPAYNFLKYNGFLG
ncbi:hypothetical protein [uncultured Corynebacterium sp.]|uniref:hypothetical protein n=1 Tax=uncultured Corynebacterium sp. TaxID=159447 RepID=UPI0025E99A8D|nr:hypothetical protein [uncultured Corynebacterium sp.]